MLRLSVSFGDKCAGFCRGEYIGHIPDTRFCNGCCGGFGIPVAQKFGARDYVTMRRYVAVSLQLAVVMSVVLAVVTSVYCADILRMMRTPENIFTGAYYYLLVTFIGVPCTFFYNLLSSIIRALGIARRRFGFCFFYRPEYSARLVLYPCLDWGVAGAAIATVFPREFRRRCVTSI